MKHELTKHKLAYAVLLITLLLSVAAMFAVWPNRILQRVVVVLLGCFYVGWGVMTHAKSRTLTRAIVKEYLGIALLGVMMLLLLITM